nr:protein tesmin/TSO1-like CXC 2 isoform X2 [Ipomoea batatas]
MGGVEANLQSENAERKSSGSEVGGSEEGGPAVMDTPDRTKINQIVTPLSKIEESPVFNFLNSLSPIEPVKSAHITQTFNSLSFSSSPSVFTSPHMSMLKESRFLRRHQLPDPSKPEFSSDNDHKVNSSQVHNLDVSDNMSEQPESYLGSCTIEASIRASYEFSKLAVELVKSLDYDCSSPNSSTVANCDIKHKSFSALAGSSDTIVPVAHDVAGKKSSLRTQVNMEGASQIDRNEEDAGCDFEGLISGTGDTLIFDSPNDTGTIKKEVDPISRTFSFGRNEIQNIKTFSAVGSGENVEEIIETENQSTQSGERSELNQYAEVQDINPDSSVCIKSLVGCTSEKMEADMVSGLNRGIRRRCLVFDMTGIPKKHLDENTGSDSGSSLWTQSDGNTTSTDKHLVGTKSRCEPSRCILPGIGLHLNALAVAAKDGHAVKHEALASGQQLLVAPGSTANYRSLTLISKARVALEDGIHLNEDANQSPGYSVNEELNQSSSPRKKKRRMESGESEGCKRCNCKKSKCLKLYCECFAAGVYCVEPCSCQDCFNKPIYEDTVIATRKQIESRNPLAFAPKVIRATETLAEIGTPASARHKRGCNCKKSGCLKKYCECYQLIQEGCFILKGGVGCSINCRCEGCTEAELEEEETNIQEKSCIDESSQKSAFHTEIEQIPDSFLPATPLRSKRPPMQPPVSLKNKPTRMPSILGVGSSSGGTYAASQGLGRPRFFRPLPKFHKQFESIEEDEIPSTLQGNTSPTSGVVKSTSPNSKRVSPPHTEFETSPGRRSSSRKLILQSIPSFPSLTPNN